MTVGPAPNGIAREILEAAARAPSAHNAQPWRLSAEENDGYLLWYAFADKLRADPDDRDGIMAVGGFYETLRLAASARGVEAVFEGHVTHHAAGISLGTVRLRAFGADPDPLANAIARRQANRHAYQQAPLPTGLSSHLEALGNVLLDPLQIAPLVSRASVMAWQDGRFVSDLRYWTRFDDTSPDGMTVDCLQLSLIDRAALKFALHRGRLPGWLAQIYAQRDVRLTRASGAVAILTTPDRDVLTLFETGRRLIRSWTLINSLGYAWHPMSIVIDQPTVHALSEMLNGRDGVAIYRVGYAQNPAAWSKRRSVDDTLVPSPH